MYTGTLDAVSNRQDLQLQFEVVDDDTGSLIDLSGTSIVFEARQQLDDQNMGVPSWPGATLSATTANGKVTVPALGIFQVWFTVSDMRTLAAGYCDVGCTATVNGITTQLMAAELPVIDGIVS